MTWEECKNEIDRQLKVIGVDQDEELEFIDISTFFHTGGDKASNIEVRATQHGLQIGIK